MLGGVGVDVNQQSNADIHTQFNMSSRVCYLKKNQHSIILSFKSGNNI